MSRTIGSPAWMTRSDASWWGEALFGPEPTIENSASSWPSARSRSRTSRATSASVRPDEPAGGDPGDHPVGRLGREPEELDLVGVLDHPRLAQHRAGALEPGAGRGAEDAQDVHRPEPVAHGEPRRSPIGRTPERLGHEAEDERDGVVRLLPGRERRRARGHAGRAPSRRGLETRDDDGDRARRRDDEHRQPLEGHRLVAGQVGEVRPDPDERASSPRSPRSAPRQRRPSRSGETGRTIDRSVRLGRGSSAALPLRSTDALEPAATVRGPSSCSLL